MANRRPRASKSWMARSGNGVWQGLCRRPRGSVSRACCSWSSAASPMVKTALQCAVASDPGLVRQNNEDGFWCDAERGVFLVVDGIGGQAAGEKATEIALARIRARMERQTGTAE